MQVSGLFREPKMRRSCSETGFTQEDLDLPHPSPCGRAVVSHDSASKFQIYGRFFPSPQIHSRPQVISLPPGPPPALRADHDGDVTRFGSPDEIYKGTRRWKRDHPLEALEGAVPR